MCRSMTDNGGDLPSRPHRDRLYIKAVHLRLIFSASANCFPEALTLFYLPNNITDAFEVNGTQIRPGAPAISALYRTRTMEPVGGGEAVFASADRVKTGEAIRFQAYIGAERVLKGGFRRGKAGGWAMECKSATDADVGVSAAEVCVVEERGVVMRERVKLGRRRKGGRGFCLKLEEIPEEGEGELNGCNCRGWESSEDVTRSDGGDWSDEEWRDGGDDEVGEMEGVRLAVDVGIWVVCLGVGLLVSRASYKSWRRMKPF